MVLLRFLWLLGQALLVSLCNFSKYRSSEIGYNKKMFVLITLLASLRYILYIFKIQPLF